MRVLLVHERYLPDSGGGGETLVHRRARYLQGREVEIRVVCAGDPTLTEHEGVPTRRLAMRRHLLPLALPTLVAEARQADLVHTFSYHAMLPAFLAARLSGRPLVCEHMALFGPAWSVMRRPAVACAYRMFEHLLVRLPADGRVFLSPDSLELGRATLGPRTILAPPGVDPAFFAPVAFEDKEDLVLFAGKFEARKGLHELLAVARAAPAMRFAAIGWGPGLAILREAAPVNLAVFESRGDRYREMLGRARIFFFPSYAETFGIVVAEAMARGCAIVGTTGQPPEGVRVEAGDVAGMLTALRDLWADRDGCLAMGARNRDHAARYDWDASGDAILGLYRTLLPRQLSLTEAMP